ncbi:MAG: DUF4011 domain-containing protein [Planctomycetota bacterium]
METRQNEGESERAPAITIAVDAAAATCASLELNGVPSVRSVLVTSAVRLAGHAVEIAIDGADVRPWSGPIEPLASGGTVEVDASGFMVPAPILQRSTEREAIDLLVRVRRADGAVACEERHRLVVQPASHWAGVHANAASLAAFVTPNAQVLAELLRAVSVSLKDRTGSGALDGYLSGSPERVQRIAEACFDALAARRLSYVGMRASFEPEGQKVRSAAEVIGERLGNCLDISVTLAALLEACGLLPVIVLGDGHAVVGFATIDEHFADPVHEGPSRLRNRLALGEMRILEATAACEGGSFGAALAAGERWLGASSDGLKVVDVRAARRAGFHPLPEVLERPRGDDVIVDGAPRGADDWKVVLPADLSALPARKVSPREARLERWKKKLLDLTLRNRLLNDRDAAGIPLLAEGEAALAKLEGILWDEHALKLIARGGVRALAPDAADDELGRRWLRAALDDGELFKRATKAYRDAISSLEESGARSLYVAVGFLEYRVEGRADAVRAPLLLVPVEMKRISRAEGFTVRATTDDTVANVALVEYMRLTHRLDIGLDGELADDEKGLDVPAVLARVRQRVRDVPGATVLAHAKLGTYSFKKLPLFEEMRVRGPELLAHPVVQTFLDRGASKEVAAARLVRPEDTDTHAAFAALRLPLPADSSQVAAVCSAAEGATFVLQGPPGTGKSQTITNLLAECLSRGKRVLFIAEKAAALEVVSERLRKCGLGGFALDLHAEHASKAEFVSQVKSTLADLDTRAAPGARQFAQVGATVDRGRARLRAACDVLHAAPEGATSVYAAAEKRLATIDAAEAVRAAGIAQRLDGVLPAGLSPADLDARVDAVAALCAAIDGLPAGTAQALHDFAPLSALTHERALALADDARRAAAALDAAGDACAALARAIGSPVPASVPAMQAIAAFGEIIDPSSRGAAELAEMACAAEHVARLDRAAHAVAATEKARAAEAAIDARFDRAVLALPLATHAGDLRAVRERFILFRWLAVRKVRGALARVAKQPAPGDLDALLKTLEDLVAADAAIKAAAPLAQAIEPFGGAEADLAAARAATAHARTLAAKVREAFPREHAAMGSALASAIRGGTLPALASAARDAVAALMERLHAVTECASPVPALAEASSTLGSVRARLERLATHAPALPAWSAASVAREEMRRLGLSAAADAVVSGALPTAVAERAVETELLAGWIRGRMLASSALADCTADRMQALRAQFSELMQEYRRGASAAIAATARDRANAAIGTSPQDGAMRSALRVLDEIRAQTTIRRPIRRVMRESAAAIAAIKPIVLASPLSAATMLPPDFPAFDLVVFDEASQVPVWDAACAVSRGKAAVIVGDSRQLPPTNFFDRKETAAEGGDSAGDATGEGEMADALEPLDSLLDEAIASGVAERSLLWHYRSRDERLIEFSNRRSYEGRLQTFPAAHRAHPNLGVEFRLVPGSYDRGGKATNRVEAEEVVCEIARRLLDDDACPANRSIGVVTFSEAQQTLVQDLLDEAVDKDPRLRERMADAEKLGEEVFVKNLENVQGDERATMIFSICYGRAGSGGIFHNFGPVNLSGGERRLNVAVTRAREKIVLVTSVRASDLKAEQCVSKGARDLRDYLAFAELGTVPATRGATGGAHEVEPSPAERMLARKLEARGWRADLHVGRSRDYRIGIALADPAKPDAWTLGIELDGAFHRSAPTVIDREVVREGVLGGPHGLGWRMLRVSVLDVLRDADGVAERIDKTARE